MKNFSSYKISQMALSDFSSDSCDPYSFYKWWLRNVWKKKTIKEQRKFAKELIEMNVPTDILSCCSGQVLGRAVSEICNILNY